MTTFLEPVGTNEETALAIARDRSNLLGRKFVVRVDWYRQYFVVPLYQPFREGYKHDAGYASVGSLVQESL